MEIQEKCNDFMSQLVSDPDLRARMCAEPAKVMAEQGLSVPEGTEIRVLEDTDVVRHIILPPSSSAPLSDASMASVAGGTGVNPHAALSGLIVAAAMIVGAAVPASPLQDPT